LGTTSEKMVPNFDILGGACDWNADMYSVIRTWIERWFAFSAAEDKSAARHTWARLSQIISG